MSIQNQRGDFMDETKTSRDEDSYPRCSSVQQERSDSPDFSCVSMSVWSIEQPVNLKSGDTQPDLISVQQERPDSPDFSCVSMSVQSIEQPVNIKSGDTQPDLMLIHPPRSDLTEPVCKKDDEFMNQLQSTYSDFSYDSNSAEVLKALKSNLRKKFQCLYEGTSKQGNPTLLNEIYTDLYITEGENGEISNEHEMRQIETQYKRAETEDTPIKCNDIFRPLPEQDKPIRTVLTKGVAGIGKTVSVQKFILDWAEGKENQDIHLIFPLPFRELNLIQDQKCSLLDLLQCFFTEIKELVKGNLIFYDEDLRECGIDVTEASVYSGLCTQIFREEFGLFQGKVYCFVHLSIQEHLAALYVHISFTNNNINVFDEIPKQRPWFKVLKLIENNPPKHVLSELHQRAVDEALQSKNGHLDLFLHFLLGLSVESNFVLLQSLMKQTGSSSTSNNKTAEYIKKKISTSHCPEKSINLFHCLNELGDHSLVEKVQDYVKSGTQSDAKFSSSQWSAVVFLFLTSETRVDEFYLKKFVGGKSKSENVKVLQKLLPVVKESRSVQLCDCDITDEGCAALASALRSDSSHMRELNLSDIKLGDSGVKQLSAGLENLHCKLEILWLRNCGVTDKGCAALASALSLNPSHLRKLDLSMNELGNSGVNLLSAGLENPHCKLQTLTLNSCGIADQGCAFLASALKSNPSHLRDLHLSDNKLGNSGVEQLSAALKNPHCKLQKLKLTNCGVTCKGLAALTSALASNPSNLRNLNLAENKLQNSGVELLSDVLENPHCKLERLWLRRCNITDAGCDDLASALISNPSHLRQLNLSWNKLGNAGVKLLSYVLENPQCKLELLWLINCGVTDEGCVALASALRSNPSHLRKLDLSDNKLGDSVKLLSALKDDP